MKLRFVVRETPEEMIKQISTRASRLVRLRHGFLVYGDNSPAPAEYCMICPRFFSVTAPKTEAYYYVEALPDGGSRVEYLGSYKMFLMHKLIPKMTPKWTGTEPLESGERQYMLSGYMQMHGKHPKIDIFPVKQ